MSDFKSLYKQGATCVFADANAVSINLAMIEGPINGEAFQNEDGKVFVPVYVPAQDRTVWVDSSNIISVRG